MRRMDHRSHTWIRRRLRSLAWLELLNIPLQAMIWFVVVGFPLTTVNIVGFGLTALLLLEGAAYWRAKRRRLDTGRKTLPGAGAFTVARWGNVAVLTAGLLVILRGVVTDPGVGSWPGLVFGLFAFLEHVNYFHVQLMYDTAEDLRYLRTRGLRRAHLARDLALYARTRA